jgi:DNA transformation protein and related proteins
MLAAPGYVKGAVAGFAATSIWATIVCAILREPKSPGQDRGRSMVASDSFAEFLREQLAPLGRVTMRRRFGKTGVFCNGLMFGMVKDNMFYLRVDDHHRTVFNEAESSPPLNYKKQGHTIDLAFWRAPERLFDEPDEFVTWARAALAAARRVAANRAPPAPRRKSKPQQSP